MDRKFIFIYGYMAVLTVITVILGFTVLNSKNECEKKTADLKKEVLVLTELIKEKDDQLRKAVEEKEKLVAKLKKIEQKIKNANKLLKRKGIKVVIPQGGLFIPANSKDIHIYAEKIEYKIDKLLKIIQDIPVGVPLYGRITSKFGYRRDPFNGKRAFHSRLDLRAAFNNLFLQQQMEL
ncbi:hypothetical protein [Hydrogenivirga sp. 128-5-R1-1]|uniref:hypothetical protein n=1 Tax=Hydrogenivirga sp. 128-5-R1-1 TaxID=392423 RepID=UPI0002DFFCF7|nr:hypothetical protein [Hydrogenivirga sp. 128-5-R1-1]